MQQELRVTNSDVGRRMVSFQNVGCDLPSRYMTNSHLGLQQSRRDDLESLVYTLIYLLNGKLPWQGIPLSRKADRCGAVLHRKQEFCKQNCDIIPWALNTFLCRARSLAFEEKPDYIHFHVLLENISKPHNTLLRKT
jgi:casein kinase 1